MLPSGIATTSHIVSHASSSNSNNNSSSATTTSSANSGSRTGRLRGLSYLRSYAHGHSHSHNNNNNNNHNTGNHNTGNHNNGNGQPANATIVTTTTTTTTITSSSSASPSFANSWNPSSPPASSRPPRQRRATSPLNNTALNSWIPTVSGVSGLSRVVSLPAAELSTPTVHATNVPPPPNDGSDPSSAVRSIDQTISSHGPSFSSQQQSSAMVTANSNGARAGLHPDNQPLPSIRFTPYIDLRSNRESLHFAPIERCLRQKDEHIRVGRASERDANNPHAPVGFSSKVVSRRHCEFWCDNGQWFVKDVKSSSGTFLNHIRLSAPGMESKAYPLNDGDILQLGIDFKGGEEQIFRCVKIRVELNRAWQKALNNFNMSAHRRLRNLATAGKDPDTSSLNTSECAICLLPVAPCQSLFVAPCSHVWHYKCIRPLVEKEYPTFLCPNCRAIADLEREIEEDEFREELWEAPPPEILEPYAKNQSHSESPTGAVGTAEATTATAAITSSDAVISGPSGNGTATNAPPAAPPQTIAVAVPSPSQSPPAETAPPFGPQTPPLQINCPWRNRRSVDEGGSSDSSGGETGHEGPLTPMNDVGPFVLDGSQPRGDRGRRETLFLPLGMGAL